MNEVERLLPAFKAEISEVYSGAMHSGVIPDGRRAGVLVTVSRLTAKYNQKLDSLRAIHSAEVIDGMERKLAKIENDYVATLTDAA